MHSRDIDINGIVQGVGFRPFAARLARELGLSGWVVNAPDGVRVHLESEFAEALDTFEKRLTDELPPAARLLSCESRVSEPCGCSEFTIERSEHDGVVSTLVSPDLATCPDCERELFDPENRRYHYPFINCTNCGPRFTIIEELPYDRPVTSMREFQMCPQCQGEYDDEADRRYHAQPNACFDCGPELWWAGNGVDAEGRVVGARFSEPARQTDGRGRPFDSGLAPSAQDDISASDALISHAAERLLAGDVLAVKGLGGWHLSCDATNEDAVAKLRERKRRPTKPLAIMCADLDMARSLAQVDSLEADLLSGSIRPIVLLIRDCGQTALAENVAGILPEIGVMLPSTPVQHLLLRAAGRPLVMTSGNMSGEPIVADDEEAFEKLGHIADGFLGNNRKIVARYDDSVVRVLEEQEVQIVRRARGYAPIPIFARQDPQNVILSGARSAESKDLTQSPYARGRSFDSGLAPSAQDDKNTVREGCVRPSGARVGSLDDVLFAAGPEQKATFCLRAGERAYVSQHLGDLETTGAWAAYQQAYERYTRLFDLAPTVLVCDEHPEYLSSKWARERSREESLPLIEVQHHHAHIASVLGENNLSERVIGVAIDGTGYGDDGTIWGGEVLLADRMTSERFWHLPQFRLPGGAAAIRNPKRTAYALLVAASALSPEERAEHGLQGITLDNPQWEGFLAELTEREMLDTMIARGLNSPLCSSAGRVFDAVSALLGLCEVAGYEGEPACLLEAAARRELAGQPKVSNAGIVNEDDLAVTGGIVGACFSEPAQPSSARGRSFDFGPAFSAQVDRRRTEPPLTAYGFHRNIANAIIGACEQAREVTCIERVALSGGCMANRLLAHLLRSGLADAGFDVYENHELPPNDGCISFGQAIVAEARLHERG